MLQTEMLVEFLQELEKIAAHGLRHGAGLGAVIGTGSGAALGYLHGNEKGHGKRDAAIGALPGAALGAAHGHGVSAIMKTTKALNKATETARSYHPKLERATREVHNAKRRGVPALEEHSAVLRRVSDTNEASRPELARLSSALEGATPHIKALGERVGKVHDDAQGVVDKVRHGVERVKGVFHKKPEG